MKNKIQIVDPDFPVVAYTVDEFELIDMIENQDHPTWWKDIYKKKLLDMRNEKDQNTN